MVKEKISYLSATIMSQAIMSSPSTAISCHHNFLWKSKGRTPLAFTWLSLASFFSLIFYPPLQFCIGHNLTSSSSSFLPVALSSFIFCRRGKACISWLAAFEHFDGLAFQVFFSGILVFPILGLADELACDQTKQHSWTSGNLHQ
jgi:hypothetical protein